MRHIDEGSTRRMSKFAFAKTCVCDIQSLQSSIPEDARSSLRSLDLSVIGLNLSFEMT